MCGTWGRTFKIELNGIKSHENEDWGILTLQGEDGRKL